MSNEPRRHNNIFSNQFQLRSDPCKAFSLAKMLENLFIPSTEAVKNNNWIQFQNIRRHNTKHERWTMNGTERNVTKLNFIRNFCFGVVKVCEFVLSTNINSYQFCEFKTELKNINESVCHDSEFTIYDQHVYILVSIETMTEWLERLQKVWIISNNSLLLLCVMTFEKRKLANCCWEWYDSN